MKKIFKSSGVIAGAAVVVLGAMSAVPAQAGTPTVSIAFQGPLSGSSAQTGQDELLGAKTALYIYNKSHPKVKVTIVQADDQGDPSVAPGVASGIALNNNVVGVVGGAFSGASQASFPYYKQVGLTMVSPSATRVSLTDPTAAGNGWPVFHRVLANDSFQGPALVRWAVQGVASPQVYTIDDQSSYGTGLKADALPEYPKVKATIVGDDTVAQGTTDYSSTALKVTQAKANVVIYFGYYADAAKLKDALDQAGYTGIFASGDGTDDNGYITDASAKDAEGTRLTAAALPWSLATAKNPTVGGAFKAANPSAGSGDSHTYVTETYNATAVFLQCISEGHITRAAIGTCVQKESFTLLNGTAKGLKFKFTSFGEIVGGAPVAGYVVKNGVITYVGAK